MINEKFKQVALRETIFDKISNLLFASKIKTFEKNEAYYFVFLNEYAYVTSNGISSHSFRTRELISEAFLSSFSHIMTIFI